MWPVIPLPAPVSIIDAVPVAVIVQPNRVLKKASVRALSRQPISKCTTGQPIATSMKKAGSSRRPLDLVDRSVTPVDLCGDDNRLRDLCQLKDWRGQPHGDGQGRVEAMMPR